MFQENLDTCSIHANYSRFNNQHDCKGQRLPQLIGYQTPFSDILHWLVWTPINEDKNLYFGNEWDIHFSSKIYEANERGGDLDLLIISYYKKWVQTTIRKKQTYLMLKKHYWFQKKSQTAGSSPITEKNTCQVLIDLYLPLRCFGWLG